MTDRILVSTGNGELRITLNRPAKKHVLTQAMYAAMTEAVELFAAGPDVQAVI